MISNPNLHADSQVRFLSILLTYSPSLPCPSITHVQATVGVGFVNFHTVDFGGAFFNWSYFVLCVLSDA